MMALRYSNHDVQKSIKLSPALHFRPNPNLKIFIRFRPPSRLGLYIPYGFQPLRMVRGFTTISKLGLHIIPGQNLHRPLCSVSFLGKEAAVGWNRYLPG